MCSREDSQEGTSITTKHVQKDTTMGSQIFRLKFMQQWWQSLWIQDFAQNDGIKQWKVMLEKVPGISRSDKLWIIQLLEADLNQVLMISFARNITRLPKEH
jgi:hypothetical protein